MTSSLRLATLAFSLAAAFTCQSAAADATAPTLPLGTPTFSNLYGLELNQWYVWGNDADAGTLVNGNATQSGTPKTFPTGADLNQHAETSQTSGSKWASALALVSPTSLGALASAHDTGNAFSSGTLAFGLSTITFAAVLDQSASAKFDIKLDGHLDANDQHKLSSDVTGAAVSALAFGSFTNQTNADMVSAFTTAGLNPYAEDEAFIRQYSSVHSTTQTHLDTFGAQTSAVDDWVGVDTTLHVTADGTRLDCDPALSPACGRYFYYVTVMLFTAAQDGGVADFSHTLEVTSVSVGGGAAQPFSAISAVPEPATTALLIAGLFVVGGIAARRARQSP